MAQFFIALLVSGFQFPLADTFRTLDWKPKFTEPAEVRIADSTIGIFTHCSTLFDPQRETASAVDAVVTQLKSRSLPRLYLHDQHNPSNPAWAYLYGDWNPTAYVGSDIGHLDVDLSQVDHVVCLGGYFEQCERSTVCDVVRLWHRDGYCHDMRITQVTDGVFSVLSYMNSGDRYERRARNAHRLQTKLNPKAIITLEQSLAEIIDEELYPGYLKRQLPSLPVDINVVLDVYGVVYPVQVLGRRFPTLTFAYRTSSRFLQFKTPDLDFERAWREWRDAQRKRVRRSPSLSGVPMSTEAIFSSTAYLSGE